MLDLRDVVHLFFLLDCSGHMHGERICELNRCMKNALRDIGEYAEKLEFRTSVHLLSFSDWTRWMCGTSATNGISALKIEWEELTAFGSANIGDAIWRAAEGLSRRYIGFSAYRPIIVLFTDGRSDDRVRTRDAILALKQQLNGRTERIFIGIDTCDPADCAEFASVSYADGGEKPMCFMLERMEDMQGILTNTLCTLMRLWRKGTITPLPDLPKTPLQVDGEDDWIL
ncbi:MAG: vWA domain-containing protein [Clostridia bacterium]|nr:vWA domain-containing protein [Clostridia bacterium]